MRKCNLQIVALVLLLAFTQKLGLRVLLHNKFHVTANKGKAGDAASYFQVQCDCLDEALMPLTQADTVQFVPPLENYIILFTDYSIHLSSAKKIYRSLRAPPVA